jgi:hypothetical protein
MPRKPACPILMTSLAFILGAVPLVMASGAGAELRQALGTAVFFGMVGVTGFRPAFHAHLLCLVPENGAASCQGRAVMAARCNRPNKEICDDTHHSNPAGHQPAGRMRRGANYTPRCRRLGQGPFAGAEAPGSPPPCRRSLVDACMATRS